MHDCSLQSTIRPCFFTLLLIKTVSCQPLAFASSVRILDQSIHTVYSRFHSLCETLPGFITVCLYVCSVLIKKRRFSPCLDVEYRMFLAQVSKAPKGGTSVSRLLLLLLLSALSQLPLILHHPRTWLHMLRDVVPDENHGWHRREKATVTWHDCFGVFVLFCLSLIQGSTLRFVLYWVASLNAWEAMLAYCILITEAEPFARTDTFSAWGFHT